MAETLAVYLRGCGRAAPNHCVVCTDGGLQFLPKEYKILSLE